MTSVHNRGTPFSKKPDRVSTAEDVAAAMKVTTETVRRWARTSDIPHDIHSSKQDPTTVGKKKILYDIQEVKLWYISQQSQGRRLPRHDRIPLVEARTRLKAVKKRLNISTEEFAKLLGVKRSTFTSYLYGARARRLVAIPSWIVTSAESLTEDVVPMVLKRTTKEMIKNAIVINKGHLGDAAESLNMHTSTFKKFATNYGVAHLLRGKPNISSKVTAKQLVALLRRHDSRIKAVAAELGVDRTTLYSLFKKAKISPKDYRRGSHRDRNEVKRALKKHGNNRALAAKELDIGVTILRSLIKQYRLKRYFPPNTKSKLDPVEVGKLFKRRKYNIRRTAKALGVSISYLTKYVKKWGLRPKTLRRRHRA